MNDRANTFGSHFAMGRLARICSAPPSYPPPNMSNRMFYLRRPSVLLVLSMYALFILLAYTILEEQLQRDQGHRVEERVWFEERSEVRRDEAVRRPMGARRLCADQCSILLTTDDPHPRNYTQPTHGLYFTVNAWSALIRSANHTIDIVGTRSYHHHNPDAKALQRLHTTNAATWQGSCILRLLRSAISRRQVRVRLVRVSAGSPPQYYSLQPQPLGVRVASLILQSSLWIVDGSGAFVGAANIDAMQADPSIGVWLQSCPCVVGQLAKAFDGFWRRTEAGRTDRPEPEEEKRLLALGVAWANETSPIRVRWNAADARDAAFTADTFVTMRSGLSSLIPVGQRPTGDLQAILGAIRRAGTFVHIAILHEDSRFGQEPDRSSTADENWLRISRELQLVAGRNVSVRLLVSGVLSRFVRTIGVDLMWANVQMRYIAAGSADQAPIFDTRSKADAGSEIEYQVEYVCTDRQLFMGTSNKAIGMGLALEDVQAEGSATRGDKKTVRDDLNALFLSDWQRAQPIDLI